MITASKLGLLSICAGSLRLPTIDSTSRAARDGTRKHRESLPAWTGEGKATTEIGEQLADVGAPEGARVEVAMALDLSGAGSARVLEGAAHRDYSGARPGELVGTGDALSVPAPWFGELKTGEMWVDSQPWNLQMGFFAVALWFLTGKPPTGTLVQTLRPVRVQHYRYSVGDLLMIADDLRRVQARALAQAEVQDEYGLDGLVVGEHCGFCPALHTCPAIGAIVGENPGEQYDSAEAVIRWAKDQREVVETMALAGPVDLPTDRELVIMVRERRKFDGDKVYAALCKEFGKAAAEACTERTVTAGAVDAWASEQQSLGTSKAARKRALDEILLRYGAVEYQPYNARTVRAARKDT